MSIKMASQDSALPAWCRGQAQLCMHYIGLLIQGIQRVEEELLQIQVVWVQNLLLWNKLDSVLNQTWKFV